MNSEPDGQEVVSDLTSAGSMSPTTRGRLLLRPWVHALLLGGVLLAMVPLFANGYPAMVDEAVYSYQAANLADGSWSSPRPLPDIDSTGLNNPLIDAHISGSEWTPYARQPMYPLMLAPLYKVGGYASLLLLSLLGAWGAAIVAARLARRMDPRTEIAVLWLTGLGTPLLFDAYVVVAHSVAAALSGTTALCLIAATDRHQNDADNLHIGHRWLAAAGAATSGCILVLVRSEGALVVGGLAVVGLLTSFHIRDHRLGFQWRRAGPPALLGAAGAAAYVINGLWVGAITGGPGTTGASVPRPTDPLAQFWNSLLRPWGTSNQVASTSMGLATICLLVGAIALRVLPRRPLLGTSLLSAAAMAAVTRHFEPVDQISGLLVTLPIVVVGLILISPSLWRRHDVQLLLGGSTAAAAGTLWLAYGLGGATEWGGRFYHVLIPLLTPVAVVALRSRLTFLSSGYRRVALSSLVVMTLSISLLCLRFLHDERDLSRTVVEETQSIAASLPNGTVTAVGTINSSGLPRLFWAQVRDGYPLLNGGNLAGVTRLLPRIERAGTSEMLLITDTGPDVAQYVINKVLDRMHEERSWTVSDAQVLGDTGYVAMVVRKR